MSIKKRATIARNVCYCLTLLLILYSCLGFYRSNFKISDLDKIEGILTSVRVNYFSDPDPRYLGSRSGSTYYLDFKLQGRNETFAIPSQFKHFSMRDQFLVGDTISIFMDPTAFPRIDNRTCGVLLIEKNKKIIFSESRSMFTQTAITCLVFAAIFFIAGSVAYYANRAYF
ncbi:hypothetical protein [Jiulongibacter sediminis]|uniref:hypothetical protein n=1 Tax=Jiulongibacter sediminis TaxID=1605367 RepID=UPI0006DC8F74|nr:hypothetical protein [Jiulongibacter sediminis]TBX25257.1 hypothetical protein TK44_09060 [Jiulongibacter sediminis]